MAPKTGPTALLSHHDHSSMRSHVAVAHDEVDELVQAHLNTNLKENYGSERALEDSLEEEGGGEGEEAVDPTFDDYGAWTEEQGEGATDGQAKDELRRRAGAILAAKDNTKAERGLPMFFAAAYPHKATEIEILDNNGNGGSGQYYIVREDYGSGHGGDGRFGSEPFLLFTVRDTVKNRIKMTLCLSPRGPAHCPPIECAPCLEAPWWETRGKGDEMVTAIDDDAQRVQVVKKGEKITKTGRLCVRMPGEHVLHFHDKKKCSRFVRNTDPLYFNP